jgi:hypothetical protein
MMVSKATEQLHTYLNDHLAGSVAAIQLLDYLIEYYPSHRLAKFFQEIRNEIAADQQVLQQLIEKVGSKESTMRKAAAWLTEKIGRVKLRSDDENDIALLQAIEMLVLGVTGKQLLWRSLGAISQNVVELQGTDFVELERRAAQQIEKLEEERLYVSREALTNREHS